LKNTDKKSEGEKLPDYYYFDDVCRRQIEEWLKEMDNKCLYDRLKIWVMITGFVIEHLKWYKKIGVKIK